MKFQSWIFILFFTFHIISCDTHSTEQISAQSEEEAETPTGVFGEQITEEGAIDASELLTILQPGDSVFVKVKGTINACCQKKGCWMDVDLGNGQSMLVRFKDYDFFVPKNAAGYTAIMEGYAKLEVQDIEWLRHKAHDAGKSEEEIAAINEPETSITFKANGVIIK
jgi:hypothetical protein